MIIRKQLKFNCHHIVRDCSSDRCKKSIHSHSYIVEVFLKSNFLDNGMMVYDFGLMGDIKELVDSFDHTYVFWDQETIEFKNFICEYSERWIEMPISPSAEGFSLILFKFIKRMLNNTEYKNGERGIELHSVRVHETATGYAECFEEDENIFEINLDDILFSGGVTDDWKILKEADLDNPDNEGVNDE